MPLYEYRCRDCSHEFEALRALGDSAEGIACPQCRHEEVDKLHSTFAASTGSKDAAPAPAGGCCMGTAA